MKTAIFTNFSDTEFIGYWNGKGKTFKPGESKYMPEYLARHFAKHLVNREILKIPNGETFTSPKFPEQVPAFMELFNKAFHLEDEGDETTDSEVDINVMNKNHKEDAGEINNSILEKPSVNHTAAGPQIVEVPDEDDDTEEAFKNLPQE